MYFALLMLFTRFRTPPEKVPAALTPLPVKHARPNDYNHVGRDLRRGSLTPSEGALVPPSAFPFTPLAHYRHVDEPSEPRGRVSELSGEEFDSVMDRVFMRRRLEEHEAIAFSNRLADAVELLIMAMADPETVEAVALQADRVPRR